MDTGFDAAMGLVERGLADEFVRRRIVEIAGDFGLEIGMVALEREQEVGLVTGDPGGDIGLAAHGIDGDDGAFELLGLGEMIDEFGNGGDLVGLLGHGGLGEGEAGIGGIGGEHMHGFDAAAAAMRAPRGFAVDGDEIVAVRPELLDPGLETGGEELRIDAVEQSPQPARAWHAEMELGKLPEHIGMGIAPGFDILEIIARTDGCADAQQQHFVQWIHDPLGIALIRQTAELLQEQAKPGTGAFLGEDIRGED